MSIWSRILDSLAAFGAQGKALAAYFDRKDAAAERSVAFTIAVISLAAKMAKADGQVLPSEVKAFRQIFEIAPKDEAAAARVFDLARQDVAGFDVYARRIGRMFEEQPKILDDILEGLFHIAFADNTYHDGEAWFLREVAKAFHIPDATFECVEARFVSGDDRDPWKVLGVPREASQDAVRARWRELVRENHPDKMIARGLPKESINLANARMTAINRAWEEIQLRSAQRHA